jgi:hypothetical protein
MTAPSDTDWRFAYEFPEPNPVLEWATQVRGPYEVATNVTVEPGRRLFRVPSVMGARFFRVRANVRTEVTRVTVAGGIVAVEFEYRPSVFALQSSAQPCGPFADDPAARFDTASQTISVSRTGWIRFFRVARSKEGPEVRLESVGVEDGRWVVRHGPVGDERRGQ